MLGMFYCYGFKGDKERIQVCIIHVPSADQVVLPRIVNFAHDHIRKKTPLNPTPPKKETSHAVGTNQRSHCYLSDAVLVKPAISEKKSVTCTHAKKQSVGLDV